MNNSEGFKPQKLNPAEMVQAMNWIDRRRELLSRVRTIFGAPPDHLSSLPDFRRARVPDNQILSYVNGKQTLQLQYYPAVQPDYGADNALGVDFSYYEITNYVHTAAGQTPTHSFKIYESTLTLIIEEQAGWRRLLTQQSPESSWNALETMVAQLKNDTPD